MSDSKPYGDASDAPTHVILLGLMGVGKTTIGRRLAEALERPLSDSDEEIAAQQGATVRELSQRLGVAAMHALESEHLLSALGDRRPNVVCAAASTVEDERCRARLGGADVFATWLRADPSVLATRFAQGPHRPDLGSEPATLLRHQMEERGERFAQVARLTVDVDGREPAEIAAEILAALRVRHRG